MQAVRFNLEIAIRSDFADLFEVKAHRVVRFVNSGSAPVYANGRASFEVRLDPGVVWHTCVHYRFLHEGAGDEPSRGCADGYSHGMFDDLQGRWLDRATRLTSSNEEVYRFYRQSVEDMGALRLYDHDAGADVWVPAAGVPWYVGANVPQARAAGSIFHLLQAILGIQADAPRERLYVDPQLPRWLPEVALQGLAIGKARVDLRFRRVADRSQWDATVREGRVDVTAPAGGGGPKTSVEDHTANVRAAMGLGQSSPRR